MIVEDAARLEFDGTLTYMYLFFTSCHCYLVNTRIYAIIISSKYRIFSYKKSQSYKKKNFSTSKSSVLDRNGNHLVSRLLSLYILDRFPIQFVSFRNNPLWEHVFTRIVSFNMLAAMLESIYLGETESRCVLSVSTYTVRLSDAFGTKLLQNNSFFKLTRVRGVTTGSKDFSRFEDSI